MAQKALARHLKWRNNRIAPYKCIFVAHYSYRATTERSCLNWFRKPNSTLFYKRLTDFQRGCLSRISVARSRLNCRAVPWAYERSCARYAAVRQSLGEPDPFRLRYRALVTDAVSEIVGSGMDKKVAAAFIKRRASEDVPREDQARFIEVVETAVMNLHEGNIARYRLRPSQYQKWKETWR